MKPWRVIASAVAIALYGVVIVLITPPATLASAGAASKQGRATFFL